MKSIFPDWCNANSRKNGRRLATVTRGRGEGREGRRERTRYDSSIFFFSSLSFSFPYAREIAHLRLVVISNHARFRFNPSSTIVLSSFGEERRRQEIISKFRDFIRNDDDDWLLLLLQDFRSKQQWKKWFYTLLEMRNKWAKESIIFNPLHSTSMFWMKR